MAEPRATVCLSLGFDVTSIWFMFGLTGAPRLLDLCERLGDPFAWTPRA